MPRKTSLLIQMSCVTVLFFCLLCLGVSEVKSQNDQNCDFEEFDKCANVLMAFRENPKDAVPVTVEEINASCSEVHQAGECLQNFSVQCLDSTGKKIVDGVVEGVLIGASYVCEKDGFLRSSYLNNAECLRQVELRKQECPKKFLQLLQIAKHTNRETAIAIVCCNYKIVNQCIRNVVEPGCGVEAMALTNRLTILGLQSVFSTVCTDIGHPTVKCSSVSSSRSSLLSALLDIVRERN